jgi:hypothetical protein
LIGEKSQWITAIVTGTVDVPLPKSNKRNLNA